MSLPAAAKGNGMGLTSKDHDFQKTHEINQNPNSNGHVTNTRKTTTLRDATQRVVAIYSTGLGSPLEQLLANCQSLENFFDTIASVRLRQMPHHSSRWDRVLKWAEFFAVQVQSYSEEVSQFADYADQAARIIWASSLSLISLGPKYISMLEKAFGIFYSCGQILGLFLRHHELLHNSEEIQLIMAASFADLLRLVAGIDIDYAHKQIDVNFTVGGFDERWGQTIHTFLCYGNRFTDTVWATRLRTLAKPNDILGDRVREFLLPRDTVTRLLAITRFIRRPRADYTCEWFSRHLTDFTRSENRILLVTGKAATGKSVLSEWVVERLRALNSRRTSEVITYTIDSDLKSEHTSLSVVKGLLLQILQLSTGDNALYRSISSAYELSISSSSTSEVESALWKAFGEGLRSDRNQTIVVDGIDNLRGGETESLKLFAHLDSIVLKHSKTKCIIFSRPLSSPVPKLYVQFSIEPEHTIQDMHFVAEYLLPTTPNFEALGKKDISSLISSLVNRAGGSFEWIFQALEILKAPKTPELALKVAGTLPNTLSELIEVSLGTIDLKHRDTKSIMAWLLAAERPLLVGEIRQLIELDTSTCTRTPRSTRIEDDIIHALGPFVDIRDGFVRFHHSTIKECLLKRAVAVTDFKNIGPFPFNIKEAHYDLAIRCMAYIKIYLTRSALPTLEPLNRYGVDELFDSYVLLQYSVRYWPTHFKASPMYESTTTYKITANFKTCFPNSTLLAVIEGSCHQFQYTIDGALDHFLLILSVRRSILGESSELILQTILNIARIRQATIKSTEINGYFYEAWKLSTSLKITSIATICAHTYIEMTSSMTITKETDIVARRIELLQYIITIQRETRVQEREIVLYLELLATTYLAIGDIEKATKCRQEIYELNIRIYGRTAPETRRSYQSLTTAVQKSTKTEEIYEITRKDYDEAVYTLPAMDAKRISLTWSLIDFYEKRKDTRRLEETLVSLWQSLTRVAHTNDVKLQESKIDIALRYVELLKHQKRNTEAEIILRTLWIDLEQHDTESATTIIRTKVVGEQLHSVGAIDAARSVFARLWAYYVKTGKQSTAEAGSVSTLLTQETREVTTETTYEVTTLVEIFEVTIVTATTITTTTVKNALILVAAYYEQENWNEVVRVGTIALGKLYPEFNSKDFKSPLPTKYYSETLELFDRVVLAYVKLSRLENAESIYRRIFYAVVATPKSPDELLSSSAKTLLEFYQAHAMLDRTVAIYKDLYGETHKRHGKTDKVGINTLYSLGDVSVQLHDTKNAEFAYREIHTNLAQVTDLCHRDAIRACLALCTVYEQRSQHSSAQKIYEVVWHTFIKHGKEYELRTETAEGLYLKYVAVLKHDSETEYATLHNLAVEYRKACVRFYGVSCEITLKATLQLAEINEKSENHREEAIAMYEEAQKSREGAKGNVSQSTLTAIQASRKRLPHLYAISKLSTSIRAITFYREEWEWQTQHSKQGHAHRDALMWLSHLAVAHAKQGNQESTLKANQIIESSVFNILSKERSAQRLADSGSKTAEIYLKSGLKTDGEVLLSLLRRQVVFGVSDISKQLGNPPKLDSSTWVFIITFSVTLAGRKNSFTSGMADLINEIFMYDEYHRSVEQKAPFLTTLVHGSRLLQFTKDIHDLDGTVKFEKDLLAYFSSNLDISKTINQTVVWEFLRLVLGEIHTIEPDVSILKISSLAVNAYLDQAKFQEAYEMSYLIDRFQQYQGGYDSLVKINPGLQLSVVLSGRGKVKCQDAKIRTAMFELSTIITMQIMKTVRQSHINIVGMPIDQLNNLSGLLGNHKNLDDLEWLLTRLWQVRDTQTSWTSPTVVGIGRCLVETQFSHDHKDLAIQLCEDICYNLRRVWGALDATTLEMHVLLSSFYTATGNHRKAMLVHEDVLRDTVSDKGDELPLSEASQIAVQHLELLKRTYQRLGKWDKEPQVYVDLYQQIGHVFGSEEGWKKTPPASVDKWVPKVSDNLGSWTRPESFEFIRSGRKHANYLRKSSWSWNLLGKDSHRLSRAYGFKSISTA